MNNRQECENNAKKASLRFWADKNHWSEEQLKNPLTVPRSLARIISSSRQELLNYEMQNTQKH